ncbi:transmembrane sugar transferase [Caballeronia calidae]|uniref:Transmembrane sugar transferase n=1 Tax=Caballeronia calidae TaxID=1777139 RepID=A0A158CPW9_9BURK|nr:transmembrane sugar transferase [Caballeronia calidae]
MALVDKVWESGSNEHENLSCSNALHSGGRGLSGSGIDGGSEYAGASESIPSDGLAENAAERFSASNVAKRAIDIFGSSTLLILLLPFFLTISFIVSRDGGNPIFGHSRIGRDGRVFRCYKFRSMINGADAVLADLLARDAEAREEWNRDFKLKNDIRITPIGRILRRTSLDELPQLWNVLVGDMSLVGPRPIVEKELPRYGTDARYYLMVKPGMTGLWQVSGRNNVDYATRVSLDVSYVKERSVLLDVTILLRTFKVVFEKDGAY